MRYIVIGGSGFVGQELIRQLKEKGENNIIVLDIVSPRSEVEYVKQDITEEITFDFKPGDIVVHLAANQYHHKVPRRGRQEFFENVNCRGTENILKKMRVDGASEMVFLVRTWCTENRSIFLLMSDTRNNRLAIMAPARKKLKIFVVSSATRE